MQDSSGTKIQCTTRHPRSAVVRVYRRRRRLCMQRRRRRHHRPCRWCQRRHTMAATRSVRARICVCTCIRTYACVSHVYAHAYTHGYRHIHKHACMHVNTHVRICFCCPPFRARARGWAGMFVRMRALPLHARAHVCVCAYTCLHACLLRHFCTCVLTHACTHVYTHACTHVHTHVPYICLWTCLNTCVWTCLYKCLPISL